MHSSATNSSNKPVSFLFRHHEDIECYIEEYRLFHTHNVNGGADVEQVSRRDRAASSGNHLFLRFTVFHHTLLQILGQTMGSRPLKLTHAL